MNKIKFKQLDTEDLIENIIPSFPTSLPANGGNADTVDGLHASSFYQRTSGLHSGKQFRDIFSTTLSSSHECWNKWCTVWGDSSNLDSNQYIENAPEISNAVWYEVYTGNTTGRGFQIAIGCFNHERKIFIRYVHDSNWSNWVKLSDSNHTHDDRYYTESEINNLLNSKAASSHTHTTSQITNFPTSLPANGGNADTLDGLHANSFLQLSGGTMTGNIKYVGSHGTAHEIIRFVSGNENGDAIALGGGGLSILSGGESASTVLANTSASDEVAIVSSDDVIKLITNLQSGWSNRKECTLDTYGTLSTNFFNGNILTKSGYWTTAEKGTSVYYYEQADTTTYDLPYPHCFVLVMKQGTNRGTALALTWNAGITKMWRNTLHDDTNSNTWRGWNSITAGYSDSDLSNTSSNICLRNMSVGTSAATTSNCPNGSWYGKYS